jgi:hypothetical protein
MAPLNLAKVARPRHSPVRLFFLPGPAGSVRREKRETLLGGLSRFLTLKPVRSREKSHDSSRFLTVGPFGQAAPSARLFEGVHAFGVSASVVGSQKGKER